MNKTVMKIMMIGLVTMLGTKAEAHYLVSSTGKLIWHSLTCELGLTGVPDTTTNRAVSVCAVTTRLVEVLCSNGEVRSVKTKIVLVGETQSDKWIPEKETFHVKIEVSDDPLLDLEVCPVGFPPEDAVPRKAEVQIDTFECIGKDPCCPQKVLATRTRLECKLPSGSGVLNPPAGPEGIPYSCIKDAPDKHFR